MVDFFVCLFVLWRIYWEKVYGLWLGMGILDERGVVCTNVETEIGNGYLHQKRPSHSAVQNKRARSSTPNKHPTRACSSDCLGHFNPPHPQKPLHRLLPKLLGPHLRLKRLRLPPSLPQLPLLPRRHQGQAKQTRPGYP